MINPRRYLPIFLLLLSVPLMGASGEEAFGCGCGGGGKKKTPADTGTEGEIPGGGGVSASASYAVDRSEIGMSWETVTSTDDGYHLSATIGNWLSQGRTLSDKYLLQHPMSKAVIPASK